MDTIPRLAIVTGGAQGIGKAISRRLLGSGWAVVMADVDAEAGAQAQAEHAALGHVRWVQADVADESQVQGLIAAALEHGGRIDALVNNAAISTRTPLETLSLADWNRVLAVNLTGPWLCAKYAAPHLRSAAGSIINIASTRALMSEPGTEAYSASKGGLVALTHALAASLAPVRVNCISPGWIEVRDWKKGSAWEPPEQSDADRAQHWAGRVGEPDDVAALAAFLVSAQAGFITGANFVVDGGMTRKMIYAE